MDIQKPNSSQAVSPITIAVEDEVTNSDAVESLCSITIPYSSCSPDTVKKPRAKWRKPEDKPHHPRTGYNFFFQLERERMLLGIDHLPILPQDVINLPVGAPRLPTTKSVSSYQHGSDQVIHPRALAGGKLGFADLARNVASKWKKLDSEIKQLFEEKALGTPLESLRATPRSSHVLPTTQSSEGFYSITPTNGTLSSTQSQRSKYLHMNHESNQREFCEFRQDGQDQIALRTILLDNAANPDGKSWQHSPQLSKTESIGEKLFRQLTEAKVISPPESRVRATSLNFYQDESCGPFTRNGVPSSKRDLSSKINRFIDEVCTVSEDLHHLAKCGSLDQRLSPPLREIEHQVEFCITEFRRLSSQVQEFFRGEQDVSNNEQYNSQRCQIFQSNQIPNEFLRDQFQHGFNIPSLLKEVRNVQSLLECSDCHLDDNTDNQTCIAASYFNDHRNTSRITSDSVVVQPSPRRVSYMTEPNQFDRNMSENGRCTNDNALVFDTFDSYRSAISRNRRVAQGGHRSNQQNQSERVRDHQERCSGFSAPSAVGVSDSGHEAIQHRHRRIIHSQQVKDGSIDSRQFSDDVVIDPSLDFCDDGSTCDLGNVECDNAFDLEPIFPTYQAM